VHDSLEQLCPRGTQVPQLALQHSMPTLHVLMPQVTLTGYSISFAQAVVSQGCPGRTHVPQLALQHTKPTLQVLMPHMALTGSV